MDTVLQITHCEDSIFNLPAGRSNGARSKANSDTSYKRVILSEEDYTSKLSGCIEKDYFPDSKKLKDKLEFLEVKEKNDPYLLRAFYERLKNRVVEQGDENAAISVTEFFNRYTSEDNESFQKIHENDIKEHRKKYHWAYESQDGKNGMLMLYYLDGRRISVAERDRMDRILDGDMSSRDSRCNGAIPWKFRVRNQVFFTPELSASRQTCALDQQDDQNRTQSCLPQLSSRLLLIADGSKASGTDIVEAGSLSSCVSGNSTDNSKTVSKNQRVSVVRSPRPDKIIQSSNTALFSAMRDTESAQLTSSRLSSHPIVPSGFSYLEEAHTPSIFSDEFSDRYSEDGRSRCHGHGNLGKAYEFIGMTPAPDPGVGVEPIMTYGDICGAPIALEPSVSRGTFHTPQSQYISSSIGADNGHRADSDQRVDSVPEFAIPGLPVRERLAHTLDTKTSSRRRGAVRLSSGSITNVPSSIKLQSSAAVALASRLAASINVKSSQYSDPALRESYSGGAISRRTPSSSNGRRVHGKEKGEKV